MSEHVIQINRQQREQLMDWLESPNGAHTVNYRLTFNAVEGGGVLVRTHPYEYVKEYPRRDNQ